jgi:hypothetical protein
MAVASMMLWLADLGRQVVYYDSSISGERKWGCGLPPANFGGKIVRETRRMGFLPRSRTRRPSIFAAL